tara:strand:- start:3507 stop:4604 length:1098 start_codon:yes stop_codon:yes gene_type:complete
MNSSRSSIIVDLNKLEQNIKSLMASAGNKDMCAIIKANAYGHGAVNIAHKLETMGIKYIAVATLVEAIELRKKSIQIPNVLVFQTKLHQNKQNLIDNQITPVISNLEDLKAFTASNIKFHLEFDTGMQRTGISIDEINTAIELLNNSNIKKIEGILSHYTSAESIDQTQSKLQFEAFNQVLSNFKENNIQINRIHLANSAGIYLNDNVSNMVRAGLAIYGLSPFVNKQLNILPIMSWHTKPCQIRRIKKGQGVSYNHTWLAKKDTVTATLPVGYADGYPRVISNKGYTLVNGIKAKIIGNICMDYMMIDITNCGLVTLDSDVILIGENNSTITASDLADWSNTISYEIVCNAGKRSKFFYLNGDK